MAKNFTVPVERVQSSDVVVSDRPFIPPGQTAPNSTSHKQPTGSGHHTGLKEGKNATQPVESPGALTGSQQMQSSGDVSATRPVKAPGAGTESSPTGPDASLPVAADRHEVPPSTKKRSPLFPVPHALMRKGTKNCLLNRVTVKLCVV